MKVLFIGGTGIISTAVSKLALLKGIDLYLLNRGTRNEFVPEGAKVINCNIRDEAAAAEILKDYKFDVVVDWIGFVPEQIEADIRLFKDKVGQYIFISSASVYQKPTTHHIITESTPLSNPYWQYSRDKIACEELLIKEYRENGFPITIVRPSHTYGFTLIPLAVDSWSSPWTIIDRILKGKKVIVHGDGTSLWTLTHNTDFAKGFIGLMGNTHAIGHSFHITSDEVLTWDQIYQTIGDALGVAPKIEHIPSEFIIAFMPHMLGSLTGDKSICAMFDNSKIKSFVPGFTATTPFSEGIRQTIEWFQADESRCNLDEEFDALMDRIIDTYESALSQAGK